MRAPASSSDPRFVHGGTAWFFGAAFVLTWMLQAPALLAARGLLPGGPERYLLGVGLSAFGPLAAAVLATARERRPGGVRMLFGRLRIGGFGGGWLVAALLAPGLLLAAGLALRALVVPDGEPWLLPPADGAHVLAMACFSFGEEVGWRGFALPRLQAGRGPVAASVILGVAWALWHLPLLVLQAVPLTLLPLMLVFFVAGSLCITYVFNRTRGSLLVAMLLHAGTHLNNSHRALPADVTPLVVHTIAFALAAAALLLVDRPRFATSRRAGRVMQ